ncbi:MAG: aquaporin [Verrucomicrobiales bacterium]
MRQAIFAELAGTFLLVFFGCGVVATAVALGAPVGLFQVAIVWGLGLAAAIFLTGHLSGAHLNPAITLAFAAFSDFPKARVPSYIAAQFAGAFLAAAAVYALFGNAIGAMESAAGIVRGEAGSEASAMIFGEYFPNPGGKPLADAAMPVPAATAFFGEFLGTALLAFAIFGFVNPRNEGGPAKMTPLAIGLTLTVLICIFAPLTMAGFNPARDLAPRLFSALAGWGSVPFSANGIGWLTVYVLAPCGGAMAGAAASKLLYGRQLVPTEGA